MGTETYAYHEILIDSETVKKNAEANKVITKATLIESYLSKQHSD